MRMHRAKVTFQLRRPAQLPPIDTSHITDDDGIRPIKYPFVHKYAADQSGAFTSQLTAVDVNYLPDIALQHHEIYNGGYGLRLTHDTSVFLFREQVMLLGGKEENVWTPAVALWPRDIGDDVRIVSVAVRIASVA